MMLLLLFIIYISHALYALPMTACIGRVSQTPYIPWDKKCKSYDVDSIEYLILYIKKPMTANNTGFAHMQNITGFPRYAICFWFMHYVSGIKYNRNNIGPALCPRWQI